jgi:hypothetical protein
MKSKEKMKPKPPTGGGRTTPRAIGGGTGHP